MYTVQNLFDEHGQKLGLALVAGVRGMRKRLRAPEAHRPGLSLTGYLKNHTPKRILVFGRVEMNYLRDLEKKERVARLSDILLKSETPAVIVARRLRVPPELLDLCEERGIALFRTSMKTMNLLSHLTLLLNGEFAPEVTIHGTLVEVFGVGLLIQGDSSVGKSEAALGLIERGHRLITDDVVKVKKRENGQLEGYGPEITKHHMEIRGIGIINVAHLYGAVCIRNNKTLDVVVQLENWDEGHFYDRVGTDDKFCEILGTDIPHLILPVKPGRDVVLLLETIALNHRLKDMGYNSAKEFRKKLLEMTSR